nr:hypothetical protein [Flavobacterium sp. ASV13]
MNTEEQLLEKFQIEELEMRYEMKWAPATGEYPDGSGNVEYTNWYGASYSYSW